MKRDRSEGKTSRRHYRLTESGVRLAAGLDAQRTGKLEVELCKEDRDRLDWANIHGRVQRIPLVGRYGDAFQQMFVRTEVALGEPDWKVVKNDLEEYYRKYASYGGLNLTPEEMVRSQNGAVIATASVHALPLPIPNKHPRIPRTGKVRRLPPAPR